MNFNFVYTPQEMFAIGIVIAIIEIIKSRVPKNLHRYLALPIAAILAVCIVIEAAGGWPGWAMLAAQGIQITLKIAFAAMGIFDLVLKKKTTTQAGEKQEKEEGVM